MTSLLLRARLLSFTNAPEGADDQNCYYFEEDGGLLITDGHISDRGPYQQVKARSAFGIPEIDHRPHLVMPGFIDTHLHFPQMQVVASYAPSLLEWLNTYTFPEDRRFFRSQPGAFICGVKAFAVHTISDG